MKYEIVITLIRAGKLELESSFPYYNSKMKEDFVSFSKSQIKIIAERNKKYTENVIFHNVQNSLYNQIYKCLLIHYCSSGGESGIENIDVNEIIKKGSHTICHRTFDVNNQPLSSFDPPVIFSETSLRILLGEDDSSYILRIIIAHWLSQGRTSDGLLKLECVWRTFERICDYIRHKPINERSYIAEGLDLLTNELITHKDRYPMVCAEVSSETYETLRQFRWRDMVENNYKKLSPASNLEDLYKKFKKRLFDPYEDKRVCFLGRDIIIYRKNELNTYGLYDDITADLTTKLSLDKKNDIDVVAILCHYTYYLRNRLFHGQSLVRGSIFETSKFDDMKIEKLTHVLRTLVVELINHYPLL